ncbi:TetR/AcrR family transcriptional regulator [Haloechinothrix sp. YIM 98757]|uniref:TetR/AcrR family transcriptional regulator n=1 Tax=Haloechinothrix aidingensis TaxID=2752311 RepID=A0A838A9K5_9PSEU|nr:TetR/AcrR family transcriptional regulator [Haloechinothrix aidingensis]MBA0125419.1 TetR/AcrR family transcriptional regulator [Haloechinothrix aidingensis]
MPYRRTPRVQARLDAQRELLLEAAVRLLAERGYAGCSVAAVAAEAGVATGSVYRHFPSKAELVAELFRRVVEREVAAVEQASTSASGVTERVTAVIETFASRALKTPRLAYALLAEPVDAPVEQQRLVFRQAFRDVVAERITEGVTAGVLPPQDASISAAALVGAIAEVMIGPLTAESADADVIPALCTFAAQALGGGAPPPRTPTTNPVTGDSDATHA